MYRCHGADNGDNGAMSNINEAWRHGWDRCSGIWAFDGRYGAIDFKEKHPLLYWLGPKIGHRYTHSYHLQSVWTARWFAEYDRSKILCSISLQSLCMPIRVCCVNLEGDTTTVAVIYNVRVWNLITSCEVCHGYRHQVAEAISLTHRWDN